jgi:hypothetical protein
MKQQQQQQQAPSQQQQQQQQPHPMAQTMPRLHPQQQQQQQQQYPPLRGEAMSNQFMQRPQPSKPQPQPPQAQPDAVVKGSIQPASGTGQYGCSLDMAFSPIEESQPAESTTDPRFSKGGKVDQRDVDSYLRLREQSGKIQSTHAMIQQ